MGTDQSPPISASLGTHAAAPGPRSHVWSRKASVAMALVATYAPFVAMALYMTAFVPCDHCKRTSWMMAPAGPGIVPVYATLAATDVGRIGDGWELALSFLATLAIVGGLLLLSRWNTLAYLVVLGLVLVGSSFAALGLSAAIRS